MKYLGFAVGKLLRSGLLIATLLPPLALTQTGCEAEKGAGAGQKILAAVRVIAVAPQDFEQSLLLTGTAEPTVAVALSSPAEGRVVKLAAREGVELREVVTGVDQDGVLHIRSGLQPGDRVVVEGQEALKEGQKVRLAGTRLQ